MKQPVFKLPNSLTILKKYKKLGNTAGDDNQDNNSEAGNGNQDLNTMDIKDTKTDEAPKAETQTQ